MRLLPAGLLLSLLLVQPLSAKERSTDEPAKAPEPGLSLTPVPAISYSPETGLLLGVAAVANWQPESAGLRTSNLLALLAYSTKHMATGVLSLNAYALDDRLFISSDIEGMRFPNKYWGNGNDTALGAEENFTIDALSVFTRPMWQVANDLYAGPLLALRLNHLREAETDGLLDSGNIIGAGGGRVVGLGVTARYDTRDNNLNATQGELLSLDLASHRGWWGSQFNYESWFFEARKFVAVWRGQVLAAQLQFAGQQGRVPYFDLFQLGGTYRLRGHYAGRYRDKLLLMGQLEYRLPLFWRLGAVVFTGAGDVAHRFDDFFSHSIKWSAGGGLRVMLEEEHRTNLTFDYGVSRDQSGLYITLGEVF